MHSTLLLSLVLVAGPAGGAPAERGFAPATQAHLAEALAAVNLTPADLSWDKRPVTDRFRLSRVNQALDHPLDLAALALEAEADAAGSPLQLVQAAGRWLDLPVPPATPASAPAAIALPGCPRGAKGPLTLLVTALLEARRHEALAFATLSDEQRAALAKGLPGLYTAEDTGAEGPPARDVLLAMEHVDLAAIHRAGLVLAQAAEDVETALASLDASSWRTRRWRTQGLTVTLGGPGDDTHEADVVLDGGGNDTYRGGRVLVDIAGDDTYRDDAARAVLDVALLVDLAGNDTYRGGDCVQGGTAGGVSLLVDAEGDDRYEAGQVSQGAAALGIGLHLDRAGDDVRSGARFVQGFGGVLGVGLLSDRAGQDAYRAGGRFSHAPLLPENFQSLSQGFAFGLRGENASGGIGILADAAGNDTYSAEVYGQGASYWLALGILVDSAGHDKYDLFQYGQGAGIHLSAGVLFDRAGHDAWSCNNGVAQGSGHDWAVGLLWDLAGDDYYQGSGMSQGGANANGIGMLVDGAGSDAYSGSREKNQGDSFASRGSIGLGLLLDEGGADHYTHGGRDGLTWTRGRVGVGLDVPDAPAAGARP